MVDSNQNQKEQISPSQHLFINFMAEIDERRASLLIAVISDYLKTGVIKKLTLNISSLGGSVFHAVSLHNFIKGLQGVEVHTHNFGQVDSSANIVFLAGQRRTCSPAATFLFHGVKRVFYEKSAVNKQELQENLESLNSDINKLVEIISANTNHSKKEVMRFFKKQKVFMANEAKEWGLVQEVIEQTIPSGFPVIVITNQS